MHCKTIGRTWAVEANLTGWRWMIAGALLLWALQVSSGWAQGRPDIRWMVGGHTKGVLTVSALSDGTFVSFGNSLRGSDMTMKSWLPPTGLLQRTLVVGEAGSAAAAPDGQFFVMIPSGTSVAEARRAADGQLLWRHPSFAAGGVAVSPNGQRVALFTSLNVTLRILDASNGAVVRDINSMDGTRYWSATFSPDSQILAAGSFNNGYVDLYQISTGTRIRRLTGHTAYVNAVAFSSNGQLLVSGGVDHQIIVWDLVDVIPLWSTTLNAPVYSVAVSPDSQFVASGSGSGGMGDAARLFNAANGTVLRTIEDFRDSVRAVAFTADGQSLITGSVDGSIRLWSMPDGNPPDPSHAGHDEPVTGVAFSPSGETAVSSSLDGKVTMRATADGTLVWTARTHPRGVNAVAYSPDGLTVAAAGLSQTDSPSIEILLAETGGRVRTLGGHSTTIRALAFSPDGSMLASGSGPPENTVQLWDVTDGRILRTLRQGGGVTSLAFSIDGAIVAAANEAGVVTLWSTADGSRVRSFVQEGDGAMAVVFSPDGNTLAASWRDKIRIWNWADGTLVRTLQGHDSVLTPLVFSSDGQMLISAGTDATIKVWRVKSGLLVTSYNQETHVARFGLQALAMAPDDSVFAYGRWDATLVLAQTPSF